MEAGLNFIAKMSTSNIKNLAKEYNNQKNGNNRNK